MVLERLEGSLEAFERVLDFLEGSTGIRRFELYRSRSRTTAGPTEGGGTDRGGLEDLAPDGPVEASSDTRDKLLLPRGYLFGSVQS